MKKNLTTHAQQRMQQRAIGQMQIRLIEYFGVDHYQKGGHFCAYIPHNIIAEIRQALDHIAGVCLIKGKGDKIKTVMHKTRRTRHTKYAA